MMASFQARIVLLVAALAVAAAQTAVEDTTGKAVSVATDYVFNSNVGGYLKFSEDVCAIKPLLKAGDYAGARKIYEQGRSDYVTSERQRTLKGVATGNHPDEPTWLLYSNYFKARGQEFFVDEFISDALAGVAPFTTAPRRIESAEKGMQNVLQVVYIFHELDEAAAKIADGNLDPVSGAPNNVDETFAIYVGKDIDCSPWGTAEKRAQEMGTMATCTRSRVNAAIVSQFQAARAAAVAGNAAAFAAAQQEIKRLISITYLQNAVKYAELVDRDANAQDENQAEGYAFFRSIEPLAAQAAPNATAVVVRLLYPGNPIQPNTGAQVRSAVGSIAAAMKISAADIGSLGATQNLNCQTSSATSLAASAVVAVAAALCSLMALVL